MLLLTDVLDVEIEIEVDVLELVDCVVVVLRLVEAVNVVVVETLSDVDCVVLTLTLVLDVDTESEVDCVVIQTIQALTNKSYRFHWVLTSCPGDAFG